MHSQLAKGAPFIEYTDEMFKFFVLLFGVVPSGNVTDRDTFILHLERIEVDKVLLNWLFLVFILIEGFMHTLVFPVVIFYA